MRLCRIRFSLKPQWQLATSLWLAAELLLTAFTPALSEAQNYRFRVAELELQVFVQTDASARLEYRILFENQPGADAIDIVDIGLPHRDYQTSEMTAAINGVTLETIRPSSYVDIGVEIPLEANAIQPGASGELTFACSLPDMVYQDTTDTNRASLQIKPTWFDPGLQVGTTHLMLAVHLPASVEPNEVTWQSDVNRYTELVVVEDQGPRHTAALWDYPNHSLSSANPKVGVSFPKRDLQRVVTMSAVELLVQWFADHPRAQLFSGIALIGLFVFTFLRLTSATGWILCLAGCGLLLLLMVNSPGWHLFLWLPLPALCVLNEWALRRRRQKYLPAMAVVEGGGIKRGLTAPEAAVLLELPLGKIVSLVIFGLIKKGLVEISHAEPLTVEVCRDFRVARSLRRKRAAEKGIVVHGYEQAFLDRLTGTEEPVEQVSLSEPLGDLIRSTADRMKGFDLSDTRDYYRRIVSRAWTEAESIGEVQQRQVVADKNIDWMMLDPDWTGRFGRWGQRGYHYRPIWTSAGGSAAPSSAGLPTPSSASQTSLGEVASSFTGWAENTAGRFAAAIDPTAMGLKSADGVVDLTVVDTITADFFESLAESSQKGGGGGGCACACAGCACACACAGGGR